MPLSSRLLFSGTTSPCLTLVMKLRTGNLEIGRVFAAVVPGAMHKQSLSGTRYPLAMKKPSKVWSTTSISLRCLTQYVPK